MEGIFEQGEFDDVGYLRGPNKADDQVRNGLDLGFNWMLLTPIKHLAQTAVRPCLVGIMIRFDKPHHYAEL